MGPFVLLGALVAGILAGDRVPPRSSAPALGLALACAAFGALARRSGRWLCAVLAIAFLGVALSQRAHDGLTRSPLTALVTTRSDADVSGTLVDDPEGSRYTTRVLVRLAAVRVGDRPRRDAGGRTVLVTAGGAAAARLRLLTAGDGVELGGWFRPLDGPDERLRWRHAAGGFEATSFRGFADPRSPLSRVANGVRGLVLAGGVRLPDVDRALVAGFLLGDTRELPYDVRSEFRDAGLSHLLVVSGENVAFVLALVGPVLRRLSLRGRLAGGLMVLTVFGAMTRWEPSVLRAGAMAACSMTALHLGRPTAGPRVLALAVLALLVVDPFLLHSVGFLLSCGASAGIALFSRRFADRLRGPRWVRESLAVTLAAQLGVAPVLIPVFGSVPAVSLPANLAAMPAVGPLTIWGLASGVAGGLLDASGPAAATVLELPTLALTRYVRAVAGLAARVPLHVDARAALVVLPLVALWAVRRRSGRRVDEDDVVPAR